MSTRTYIIPMRVPSAPRTRHGKGRTYQPADYRDSQRELRRELLKRYGPFTTIEPAKRITAAPTKGREARPPFRNVRLDMTVLLTEDSASDIDNLLKFALDALGPLDERHATREDKAMGWVPLYRNDRYVVGGTHLVFEHQPYNELRLTITELHEAMQPKGASDD